MSADRRCVDEKTCMCDYYVLANIASVNEPRFSQYDPRQAQQSQRLLPEIVHGVGGLRGFATTHIFL